MKRITARHIAGGAFLIWIVVIICAFFLVQEQRPLTPAQVRTWSELALALGGAALMYGAALSLGAALLQWIGYRDFSAPAVSAPAVSAPAVSAHAALTAVTLGLGGLSALMLVVGMLGGANRWGAGAVLTLALLLAPRRAWRLAQCAAHRCAAGWATLSQGARLYLALTLGMTALAALLPPTDWDGLFYHLTGPRLALAAGRIGWMARFTPHFNYPWLGEALFMQGMALFGDTTARLIHYGALLLLCAWIAGYAWRHHGAPAAETALLFCLSLPMLAVLGGWAYTDLFLALFAVAETALLAEAFSEQRPPVWWGLAGLAGGFTIGVKYTALLWPVMGGLLTLAADGIAARRPTQRTWSFALGGALAAAPWLLKNLWLTGNPAYPFAFGGPEWDAFRSAWYGASAPGLWGHWGEMALLPLGLTLGLRDMNFFDGRTGAVWLLLLPLSVAGGVRQLRRALTPARLRWAVIAALGGAHALGWTWGVLWSAALYQTRLLLPALAIYAWPAAAAYRASREWRLGPLSLHHFLRLVIGVLLASNLLYQARALAAQEPLAYLMGMETREEYLAHALGAHWEAMQAINRLPETARVAFLWEPRSYYATRYVEPDAILDRWAHLCHLYGDANGAARAWQRAGITHILLYRQGMTLLRENRITDPNTIAVPWDELDRLLADWLIPLTDAGAPYVLYTWKPAE